MVKKYFTHSYYLDTHIKEYHGDSLGPTIFVLASDYAALEAKLARVKAQSLRVVPDGEPCDLDELDPDCWTVSYSSNIYYRESNGYSWASFCDSAKPPFLQSLSIVQPVRLERWESTDDHD